MVEPPPAPAKNSSETAAPKIIAPAAPAPAAATPQAARPQTPAPELAPPPVVETADAAPTTSEAPSAPQPAPPEKAARPARAARQGPPAEAAAPAAGARPGPQANVAAVVGQAQPAKDATSADAATEAGPQLAEARPQTAEPQGPQAEAAPPSPPAETATAHTPVVAAVRGSPETVASLAAQIVRKLGSRSTQFDLQLDPAGLGRVNVRVAIDADGRMTAAMSFDNPQAAAELKSRSNELQRALSQSGFDLSGGLSFDVTQDQGNPWQGQQNAWQEGGDAPGRQTFRGRAFATALETAGAAAQTALPGDFYDHRVTPSGVDVRI